MHTKAALRQILQNLECSGRLAKWSIELREYNFQYKSRAAIKGQNVANFILEFINLYSLLDEDKTDDLEWESSAWTLFVDRSSNKTGSRAGVVLQNPLRERTT